MIKPFLILMSVDILCLNLNFFPLTLKATIKRKNQMFLNRVQI